MAKKYGSEQEALDLKKNPVTPEERARFGVSVTGNIDSRTLQAILDDRVAEVIADRFAPRGGKSKNQPSKGGAGGGTGGRGGRGRSGGGMDIGSLLAQYITASLGNVAADTAAQRQRITDLQGGLKTRYEDYLARLRAANTAAQGNINTATTNLLATIPQQATANPIFFQQPTAASNVYGEYMRSLGYSAPEVAAMQNYTDAQATAANEMARQSAEAQRAAQQSYLDNLRTTAQMAGTAANQRLAAQLPSMEMAALANYNQGLGTIGQSLQGVETGAAQARQSTLDALLPILLQYPSAARRSLGAFGITSGKSGKAATGKKTTRPRKPSKIVPVKSTVGI